jgi:hypothetical protein
MQLPFLYLENFLSLAGRFPFIIWKMPFFMSISLKKKTKIKLPFLYLANFLSLAERSPFVEDALSLLEDSLFLYLEDFLSLAGRSFFISWQLTFFLLENSLLF